VRQEEEQGALVTGEGFRPDSPLRPYLRKENLPGATVEEVAILAPESTV